MSRLHILFIPSWYPSENEPLLGTFFREQAEMFEEVGHKVGVIYPKFHDLPSKSWLSGQTHGVRVSEENGLTVVRAIQRLRQPGPLQRIPLIYRAAVKQRERLALKMYDAYTEVNGKPDIIHAKCTMWGAILARAVAEREGIPWVVTVGASIFSRGIAGPRERVTASKTLTSATYLASVSNSLADDLDRILNIPKNSFTLVPNMIDIDNFPLTPRRQDNEFVWGYMANMVADKGHETLLRAFALVDEGTLQLAGDGPLRGRIENLVSELGLSNRVSFTGNIPREVAPHFFQNIDAFVHPSRYETFGIVLVEALATGRPVVATRCGGPNDIVREEDGILVDVDDVAGLASAMNAARSHQWDSSAMRAGVEERYTKEIIREQLLTIYDSLI